MQDLEYGIFVYVIIHGMCDLILKQKTDIEAGSMRIEFRSP